MFIDFKIDVSQTAGADEGLLEMEEWENVLKQINLQMAPRNKGFHVSKLWVQSEAAKEIVSSTLTTFAISCGCAFIGMALFTESPHLSIIAVTNIVCVIVWLLWFMTVFMMWSVGPLEVLSLIVFV